MIFWAYLDAQAAPKACRHAGFADRRHGAQYRTGEARTTSVAARGALRALLQAITGRSDWQIVVGPRGKPEIRTPQGVRGPAVSIAHSHGAVAVACADSRQIHDLGIDLEIIRPRKAYARIAARAFGPKECRYIEETGSKEAGLAAFYQIWTLREAMGKATGAGLLVAADGADKIHLQGGRPPFAKGWTVFSTACGNAQIALAIPGAGEAGLAQRLNLLPGSSKRV